MSGLMEAVGRELSLTVVDNENVVVREVVGCRDSVLTVIEFDLDTVAATDTL